MSMLWIVNPDTRARRSEPRPGFPKGKYRILPGSEPDRYVLTAGEPPAPIMVGKLEECKDCAAACEDGPLVLEYEPELSDLAGLTDNAAALVLSVRRVAISGERLEKLLRRRAPTAMLELELSILRKVVGDLSTESENVSAGVLK